MANNKRDLTVGIDGDPKGFDGACKSAEESAAAFDRELGKLERQQAMVEQRTKATADAIRKYGRDQDRAALQAKRLGDEAKRAGEQAARAQAEAAREAERLADGEGDAARAAELAARADAAVERAALKAAEAHRAAGRAANQQAQQERQLARDATLAAASERLAALRASGNIKEHNKLVGSLQAVYGDLSREGSGAFQTIEKSGSSALTTIADLIPLGPAALVALLAALPVLAVAAGGALTLGLGGALAAVGLYATKGDQQVKAALHGMASHVAEETKRISAPFKATWLEIAETGQDTFDDLVPYLQRDFAALAPYLTNFVRDLGAGFARLGPMFDNITSAADNLMAKLGPKLPGIFDDLGRAISLVVNEVGSHPDLFVGMVQALVQLVGVGAGAVVVLMKIAEAVTAIAPATKTVVGMIGGLLGLKHASNDAGWSMGGTADAADSLGGSLGTTGGMTTGLAQRTNDLLTTQRAASLTTKQLTSDLDRLTSANQASFDSTTNYRMALLAAVAAAKSNNAGIDKNTKAANSNRQMLSSLAASIRDVMEKSNPTSAAISEMRRRFIAAAEGMHVSHDRAVALANKLLGVRDAANKIPGSRTLTLHDNTSTVRGHIASLQRSITNLHGKTVTIDYIERVHRTLQAERARADGGYVDGYATGGAYPRGGPVRGPGTTTSDSVNSKLSNHEYVVNARDTAINRSYLDAMNYGHVPMADMLTPMPVAVPVRGGDGAAVTVVPPDVHVSIDGKEVFHVVQDRGRDYTSRNHGRSPFATAGSGG